MDRKIVIESGSGSIDEALDIAAADIAAIMFADVMKRAAQQSGLQCNVNVARP